MRVSSTKLHCIGLKCDIAYNNITTEIKILVIKRKDNKNLCNATLKKLKTKNSSGTCELFHDSIFYGNFCHRLNLVTELANIWKISLWKWFYLYNTMAKELRSSIRKLNTNLSTCLHHNGDSSDQVSCLLTHFGVLVVQSPQDGTADLRQVRFGAQAKSIDDSTKPVQHDNILDWD